MPRPLINATVKLSKAQWKVLLERVLSRGQAAGLASKEGAITEKGMGKLMALEPPIEQEVGALYKNVPLGAEESVRTVERFPIAEARARYLASPEEYSAVGSYAPPAKVMSRVPSGSPEELAASLAYSRVKQVPVIPPSVSKAQGTIARELRSQDIEAALRKTGVAPGNTRSGVKEELVLAEQGLKTKDVVNLPPAAQMAADAMIADELWRDMGGGRSIGAKVWETLRASSRQKAHIKTNRDYFISSFVRWKQNPNKFKRAYPREANIMGQLWNEFKASLPEGVK